MADRRRLLEQLGVELAAAVLRHPKQWLEYPCDFELTELVSKHESLFIDESCIVTIHRAFYRAIAAQLPGAIVMTRSSFCMESCRFAVSMFRLADWPSRYAIGLRTERDIIYFRLTWCGAAPPPRLPVSVSCS